MREKDRPPAPPIARCVHRGMIGYDEFKHRQNLEAWADRQVTNHNCAPEIRRLAFVTKLRQLFPCIDVQWISEQIIPWDMEEFKRRVRERQEQYLEEVSKP